MITYTADGGARQDEADLWCSYAAVRALAWLGQKPADPDAVEGFLLAKQNPDGGFAWQRGLPSDMWATYYATEALADLGRAVPGVDRLSRWLPGLRTPDGGFAMMPGQPADIWATYYAARVHNEILGTPVSDVDGLGHWLAATQHASGGLAWQPGSDQPDTRASYYGALAWRAAAGDRPMPVDRAALVRWLRDRQAPEGGFGFTPTAGPCVWASFRGVRVLRALGATPRDEHGLRRWLRARRLPGGGFERWPGYGRADVWAGFCVAGTLAGGLGGGLDGALPPPERESLAAFLRDCQLPGSGFTYREPHLAGDSLATAAALISSAARGSADHGLADWLRAAQLPAEDGVMYMPGRGAEMRCTLWAAAALSTVDEALDPVRLARWLRELQNVDGGFGYWHGRGSDLVSTVSAVELAFTAGLPLASTLDTAGVRRFLATCDAGEAFAPTPGAGPTLTATMQAARALALLGEHGDALALGRAAQRWASPLGGYAATPRHVPDLMSTYQAVLTRRLLGLTVDADRLRRFLAKVRAGDGFSWSPLSRQPAGPLADCLGVRLAAVTDDPFAVLPRLNL